MKYSDKMMEHFRNPKNEGEIKNPDGVGKVGNPVCGDIMEFYDYKMRLEKIASSREAL
jgi:nitrogen fixation NifU-like protein